MLKSRVRDLVIDVLEREFGQRADLCPNCCSVVEKEYILCPECGRDLKKPCENRRRVLRLDWDTCLYCATVQKKNINW